MSSSKLFQADIAPLIPNINAHIKRVGEIADELGGLSWAPTIEHHQLAADETVGDLIRNELVIVARELNFWTVRDSRRRMTLGLIMGATYQDISSVYQGIS